MRLDLSKIRTAHERYQKVYSAEAFASENETFRVVAPVSLEFDIEKDKEHFKLLGGVKTVLELPCSRCLEPFTIAVEAPFELRYQPRAENAGEGEREIEDDDLTTAFYENDEIDLGHLMREQFNLSLPMKPLCRDDCRGLCPVCGINLNKGSCECKRDWDDPRFGALRKLGTEN
jgi:DUF177 domain-containing protein